MFSAQDSLEGQIEVTSTAGEEEKKRKSFFLLYFFSQNDSNNCFTLEKPWQVHKDRPGLTTLSN